MSKALIYTANTTAVTVPVGNTIPVGSIIRRYGCISATGSAINLVEAGYYDVDISATFGAAATGDVTLTLLQDGAAVPGANTTETISVANTQIKSATLMPIVRVKCCGNSTLSVAVSGNAATVTNFTVKVIKV